MGGEGLEDGPPLRVQVTGDAEKGGWTMEDREGVAGGSGTTLEPVTVVCQPCSVCGERSVLDGIDPLEHLLWRDFGKPVQDAFPNLDADQRELLISGTHAHCWERLFGGDDE